MSGRVRCRRTDAAGARTADRPDGAAGATGARFAGIRAEQGGAEPATAASQPRQFHAAWIEPARLSRHCRPSRATGHQPGTAAAAQSSRTGLPDAGRPGGNQRRHQRLPDHHDARRRFRHRGAQWQWDQHDHTFGRHDRDGTHPTLNWPTLNCPTLNRHDRCRCPADRPVFRLAARADRHVAGEVTPPPGVSTVGDLIAWLIAAQPRTCQRVRQPPHGALRGEPGFRRAAIRGCSPATRWRSSRR